MSRDRRARERTIVAAAVRVLAEQGMRGFTHRAVDTAAALPVGSTSYYFRTRVSLLQAVVDHLATAEGPSAPELSAVLDRITDADGFADLIADQLCRRMTAEPQQTIARYELSLEARRRPELRALLEAAGAPFRATAGHLLARLGATDPDQQGRVLVACCDGLVYDALVGAGTVRQPHRAELRQAVHALLTGLLASRAATEDGVDQVGESSGSARGDRLRPV